MKVIKLAQGLFRGVPKSTNQFLDYKVKHLRTPGIVTGPGESSTTKAGCPIGLYSFLCNYNILETVGKEKHVLELKILPNCNHVSISIEIRVKVTHFVGLEGSRLRKGFNCRGDCRYNCRCLRNRRCRSRSNLGCLQLCDLLFLLC
jgi:hypothetical protein